MSEIDINEIVVIDNFLDPPLHEAFDFCTRYYTDFKYGRTSADYELQGSSDSRYFSKILFNSVPDPTLQQGWLNSGDEIFYRYVCGKLKEKWKNLFTYDSSKFFIESRYTDTGLWVYDVHMNFRSCTMTDQWHRDANPDASGDDLFHHLPNWNSENRQWFKQYTFNLMLGNNFEEGETGFEIEGVTPIPWRGNRIVVFPSEYPHKVYWDQNVNTKEMRLTYTMFGILIKYNIDKNLVPREIRGPIDQHDMIGSHNYSANKKGNT